MFQGELAGACGLYSEADKVPGSLLAFRGFGTGDWICSRSEGVGLAQVKSDSVPEPGTILLVAFGIVVMLGRFRGRMRR